MIRTMYAMLATVAGLSAALGQQPAASPDAPASFVESPDAAHWYWSGSCWKTGALRWFCRPDQTARSIAGAYHRRCTATFRNGN